MNAAERLIVPLFMDTARFGWRDYKAPHAYRGTPKKLRRGRFNSLAFRGAARHLKQ